jgi:preprotein translocase subunit SecE
LTVRDVGSRYQPSSAARRRISATNVFPKQDPPVGLILKGWAANTYLVETMPKISPFKFLQEVRAEAEKVTWPTRKETTVTTIMVFVMVAVASVFFLLADQVMRIVVTYLLSWGA